MTIHLYDPQLMAGVWSAAREVYVVNQQGRVMREAVAAAISSLNKCPYCVTVHTSLFASTGGNIRHLDEPAKLTAEISAAYEWAKKTLEPGAKNLQHPSVAPSDIPQIFGTAVVYHYLNRVISVFLGEVPVALPGMKSSLGQKMMRASFTFFGNRFANLDPQPGQFITPENKELPHQFSWAASNTHVAKGLAQFAWAAEQAGAEAVPKEVRALVLDHLSNWRGEHPPLSRQWLEDLVAPLNNQQKPAARLALLSARAAWQVDGSLIKDFRKITPGDKVLLQTVAWASFAAARHIAGWFPISQSREALESDHDQ